MPTGLCTNAECGAAIKCRGPAASAGRQSAPGELGELLRERAILGEFKYKPLESTIEKPQLTPSDLEKCSAFILFRTGVYRSEILMVLRLAANSIPASTPWSVITTPFPLLNCTPPKPPIQAPPPPTAS